MNVAHLIINTDVRTAYSTVSQDLAAYMDSAIKRRENSHLFYKIINNLVVVPHSCLEKADVHTRKNYSQKFLHIGYNIDPYGQSFFPNCISAWNGLAQDIAEANTLDIFKSKLQN